MSHYGLEAPSYRLVAVNFDCLVVHFTSAVFFIVSFSTTALGLSHGCELRVRHYATGARCGAVSSHCSSTSTTGSNGVFHRLACYLGVPSSCCSPTAFLGPYFPGRSHAGTTACGSGLIRGPAFPSSAATSSWVNQLRAGTAASGAVGRVFRAATADFWEVTIG